MLEREILGRNAEVGGIESAGLTSAKIIFTIDRSMNRVLAMEIDEGQDSSIRLIWSEEFRLLMNWNLYA